ncbi:hypothetical protein AVEN_1206-1 [Araneus ventricosus]|uniref:Uncharacterized protein n=1 Tax=Araneus ventricosus TaxID=182803 RepID=A0A4Y2NEH4_ARAVE|nr:hypothetical protein AVEN_1206-1 [Araneus ventricosus]
MCSLPGGREKLVRQLSSSRDVITLIANRVSERREKRKRAKRTDVRMSDRNWAGREEKGHGHDVTVPNTKGKLRTFAAKA